MICSPSNSPPPGKGKDSSTKGDKGSKGKGKGDELGKGKGSPPSQLRWKPRDRFLEGLTADGKAKYIEYLKSVTCQGCGKKGHGAVDCPTHPPTQDQINQAFSGSKGAGKVCKSASPPKITPKNINFRGLYFSSTPQTFPSPPKLFEHRQN